MMHTTTEAITEAEARRDAGMELAAMRKRWLIERDTLAFLDAIMDRPDRTASTDDTVDDLRDRFADGGRWRGSIPSTLARQGLIRHAGVIPSCRVSRHRGYVTLWRALDIPAIERRRSELRRWLTDNPEPVEPSLFENETPDTFTVPGVN